MWEQRFFTDGTLAPCWGYQVDETASVIYGIYDHYTRVKEKRFLKDNLKMLEGGIKFLEEYVEDIIKEKGKMHISYDLWEMHEGVSIYSLSCIYAAFSSMIEIYEALAEEYVGNKLKQEEDTKKKQTLENGMKDIKEYIEERLYDEEKKSFLNNEKDRKIDISILGLVVPFNIFSPNDKKIENTIESINMNLRTYTGGYLRFEQDHYTTDRPWVIATLWMALYYIKVNDIKSAKECFDFVVSSSTKHGFLAEQVENSTMKSVWVIGLAWSHAMFITVLEELIRLNVL